MTSLCKIVGHLQFDEDRLDERVTFWTAGAGVAFVVVGVPGARVFSSSTLLSAADEPLN